MEFSNKVVVITGGAGGIGMETARIFARKGAAIKLPEKKKKRKTNHPLLHLHKP